MGYKSELLLLLLCSTLCVVEITIALAQQQQASHSSIRSFHNIFWLNKLGEFLLNEHHHHWASVIQKQVPIMLQRLIIHNWPGFIIIMAVSRPISPSVKPRLFIFSANVYCSLKKSPRGISSTVWLHITTHSSTSVHNDCPVLVMTVNNELVLYLAWIPV